MSQTENRLDHMRLMDLKDISRQFDSNGEVLARGRNVIKLYQLPSGKKITVKQFKIPNAFNQFIYRWFRKSKAHRSFENTQRLRSLGIDVAEPMAFIELIDDLKLSKSYFACEYIEADYTFRDLNTLLESEHSDKFLKSFAEFTFNLHEKGVDFLDYSPGNILIKKDENDEFLFYLVDVNRMKFQSKKLSFRKRMLNMSRLTKNKSVLSILTKNYAELYGHSHDRILNEIWFRTQCYMKKQELHSSYHKKTSLLF